MVFLGEFKVSDVGPATGPLPPGKYSAMITTSELKSSKAGTGKYLQLTFTIIEGTYQGRQLWTRLNLENPNATAVRMARAELAAICRAVGLEQIRDSTELHNLPMVIIVNQVRRPDTGNITNQIRGYEKLNSQPAQQNNQVPNTPPWGRPQ